MNLSEMWNRMASEVTMMSGLGVLSDGWEWKVLLVKLDAKRESLRTRSV
jgi:hypothetical protein